MTSSHLQGYPIFLEVRYGFGNIAMWYDKAIVGMFPYVWDLAPIQGFGFAYHRVFDSAYLQMFVQGGLVSATIYMSIVLAIIFIGISEWKKGYEAGRLLTFLGVLALLGGVGQPFITVSRANVIFWIFILLILALRSARIRGENKLKST